jgi:hypothetical protein
MPNEAARATVRQRESIAVYAIRITIFVLRGTWWAWKHAGWVPSSTIYA